MFIYFVFYCFVSSSYAAFRNSGFLFLVRSGPSVIIPVVCEAFKDLSDLYLAMCLGKSY